MCPSSPRPWIMGILDHLGEELVLALDLMDDLVLQHVLVLRRHGGKVQDEEDSDHWTKSRTRGL